MRTVPGMLAATVASDPARVAVVEGPLQVSYRELAARVAALSATLAELGVRRGSHVALLLPNGVDFLTGYFAIASLGAIVVPLNEQYGENELDQFIRVSSPAALIASRGSSDQARRVLSLRTQPCKLLIAEEQVLARGATRVPAVEGIEPHSPVMLQFSSGSTGAPKTIVRTHANLVVELDGLTERLRITSEDRVLGVAPFSHVNGLMRSMMASVRAGATLYPLTRFARHGVAEAIEKSRLTVFIGVPFMFSMLAKANFREGYDFSSLRVCVSASAPMPVPMNLLFREKFGLHVRQLYGSTETGTISVNLSPDIENSLDSVGTPIPGVEVAVFTEQGGPAGVGERGELAVRSPAAITGYVDQEEFNRQVFRDGYFFTGDLGRRDDRGLLYIDGRKKFFINKGGYKVDPAELERLLESHAGVEEAIAIGVPTAYGDEKIKAVVVRKGDCTAEELIEHCRGKVADFKVPSVIEFREELPKSPTGKVLRKLLLES